MNEGSQNKFSFKRFLMAVLIVLLTALVVGGGVWFFVDEQARVQKEQSDRQISELQKRIDDLARPSDVKNISNWKAYEDPQKRFTIKYPISWSYKTNAVAGDASLGSNTFAADNVIFYNSDKNLVIGLNVGELFGRGGVCTKRTVLYNGVVTSGKLVVTKESDETKSVSNEEYCGVGEALTGFQATVKSFTHGSQSYFFHSENVSATDSQASETIDIFEKMAATLTLS